MGEARKVQVVYLGKTCEIEPREYDDLVKQVFARLDRYILALIDNDRFNQKTYREYLEQARIRNGLFDAVAQAVIVRTGGVKYPNATLAATSMKACANLTKARSSRDLKLLKVALPQAERAVNAFSADVRRFLSEFTGSAETGATVLMVTSAASFAIVGALAVPVMVGAGVGATTAAVAAGGGVKFLESAATELGNVAAGQKVDPFRALKNIGLDTAFGALTGGVVSKLPLGFVDKMAKGLAPRLASRVPGIAAAQLEPFLARFLTGTGEETIRAAVGEAIGLVSKIAKTGKAPTRADFDDAVMKVLLTAMTAGILRNLLTFQKKWAYKGRETLEGRIFPDALKTVLGGRNELPPTLRAKVWAEVWNKVSEEVMKVGVGSVLNASRPDGNEARMLAHAAVVAGRDVRLRKLVEVETRKALRRHKLLPA